MILLVISLCASLGVPLLSVILLQVRIQRLRYYSLNYTSHEAPPKLLSASM